MVSHLLRSSKRKWLATVICFFLLQLQYGGTKIGPRDDYDPYKCQGQTNSVFFRRSYGLLHSHHERYVFFLSIEEFVVVVFLTFSTNIKQFDLKVPRSVL